MNRSDASRSFEDVCSCSACERSRSCARFNGPARGLAGRRAASAPADRCSRRAAGRRPHRSRPARGASSRARSCGCPVEALRARRRWCWRSPTALGRVARPRRGVGRPAARLLAVFKVLDIGFVEALNRPVRPADRLALRRLARRRPSAARSRDALGMVAPGGGRARAARRAARAGPARGAAAHRSRGPAPAAGGRGGRRAAVPVWLVLACSTCAPAGPVASRRHGDLRLRRR